jgi:hypothetical protein
VEGTVLGESDKDRPAEVRMPETISESFSFIWQPYVRMWYFRPEIEARGGRGGGGVERKDSKDGMWEMEESLRRKRNIFTGNNPLPM